MKIKALAVAAIIALGAAGAANAGTFWGGVEGGLTIPTGNFIDDPSTGTTIKLSDAFNMGYNAGVTGTYMLDPTWGIGLDVAYHSLSGSDDLNALLQLADGPGSTVEAKMTAVQYTPHVVWMAPVQGSVQPWLKLGVGGYNVGVKLDNAQTLVEDDAKNKFGFNAGGGVMFKTSPNMGVGVGAAYHVINTKDEGNGEENTNLITLNAKLLWRFGGAAQ